VIRLRHGIACAGIAAAFLLGTRFGVQAPEPPQAGHVATPVVRVTRGGPPLRAYAAEVREAVRAELGVHLSQLPVAATATTEADGDDAGGSDREPANDDARTAANEDAAAIIAGAKKLGRWSERDSDAVRAVVSKLPAETLIAFHGELMAAVVAGDLVVEYDGPLF